MEKRNDKASVRERETMALSEAYTNSGLHCAGGGALTDTLHTNIPLPYTLMIYNSLHIIDSGRSIT